MTHDYSPLHDMHDTLAHTRACARAEARSSPNLMLVRSSTSWLPIFSPAARRRRTRSEALCDALQVGDFNDKDHEAFCQGPNNADLVSTNAAQAPNDAHHGARQQLTAQPTPTDFADAKADNTPNKVALDFLHPSANYDDQVRDTVSSYDRQNNFSSFLVLSTHSPC